jgi:dolichyl-phosphate beta-glucosyltransferase
MKLSTLTWILPAHNEAATLPDIVGRLSEECASRATQLPRARVLIVENGSTDATWQTAKNLEVKSRAGFEVMALRSPDKGIGYAYALGMREAARLDSTDGHWLVASAADLPFGMTDVDRFLPAIAAANQETLLIGSKRHPASQVERTWKRELMTLFFFLLRRILLRSRVRDSQGTLCLAAPLAPVLLSQTQARDFFFSTELIYRAERRGTTVIEVPITLEPEVRKTSVHAVRDGLRMLGQIFKLLAQR